LYRRYVAGIALSRTGKLCLAQVAPSGGPVYLVDVTALGHDAFGPGRFGELLESTKVLKLIFDCRGDSDALYHQYGVGLAVQVELNLVRPIALKASGFNP
jgi:exonuclease 3'-5' domain-containing protein 1